MDMKSHGDSMIAEDLRELTAHQPFEPDLDAITRRGRQLRRQRLTLVSGGIAAVAALAVAAGTIYGQAGTQHRPTAAGNVSAAPADSHVAELTARITSLMRTAQAAHPTEVDKVIAKSASGTTESIVTRSGLELQTTWDANGVKQRVVYTQLTGATSKNPEAKVLDINYAGRVATAQTISLSKTSSKPIPVTLYPDAYLPGSPGTKLAGTVTVNGQPAYEFTIPGASGFDCTIWVSKADYLPLKEVAHQGATTYDYSWSFDSASAPARPSIPAGFKHN